LPYGIAPLILDDRGDVARADRMVAVMEHLRNRRIGRMRMAKAAVALLFARRAAPDPAREYMDEAMAEESDSPTPMVREMQLDVLGELGAWAEAPQHIASSRAAAERAGLLALPVYADRLDGRVALAEGRSQDAVRLLERARARFQELGARWEAAFTELRLAEAQVIAGDREGSRRSLGAALPVFEELSSLREIDEARAMLARLA
jgi:hypothetical protein